MIGFKQDLSYSLALAFTLDSSSRQCGARYLGLCSSWTVAKEISVMIYPSLSLEFASYNFWLISRIKSSLKGPKLKNEKKLKQFSQGSVNAISTRLFVECYRHYITKMRYCVEAWGHYSLVLYNRNLFKRSIKEFFKKSHFYKQSNIKSERRVQWFKRYNFFIEEKYNTLLNSKPRYNYKCELCWIVYID